MKDALSSTPDAPRTPVPLPAGYRQGVITAITLVVGFSLVFARYWTFEAEGDWTLASDISAVLLALAIGLEFVALWRALLPEDDDEPVYRVTLRWFFASVVVLAVSVVLAGFIAARVLK